MADTAEPTSSWRWDGRIRNRQRFQRMMKNSSEPSSRGDRIFRPQYDAFDEVPNDELPPRGASRWNCT
eukprot:5209495-Pyramimonas_sp.AAC.1